MVEASDREIVRDVRRGDREAFGQLVRRYQNRVFSLTLMMVRQRDGAYEDAQDAVVRAYTHIHHYDESRPLYPWLAAIAVRGAQNWLRAHGRTAHVEGSSLDTAKEPGTSAAALTALIADEQSCRLWRVVAALSSGERTALTLYYRDGLPIGDIARALGVTDGTVKTLLFRARRHLRERLHYFFDRRESHDM